MATKKAEAATAEATMIRYSIVAYVTRVNDKGQERFKKVATFTSPEGDSATAVGALLKVLGELTEEQRGDITKMTLESVDANAEVSFNFPDA